MRSIKGYENKYYLDANGNVFRYVIKRKEFKRLNPMKLNGYLAVDLGLNGVIKRHLVHRLMAINFLENKENKEQVNHINGIKTDNTLANIEWVTRSENQLHSIKIGLRHTMGEKNSQSKLNEKLVMEIFNSKGFYKNLSLKYNVSISTISDIKRGYSWTHITKLQNLKTL